MFTLNHINNSFNEIPTPKSHTSIPNTIIFK